MAGEFSDIEETEPTTQPSDDLFGDITEAFDEFAKTLSDAVKPRLAMGWYVCMLSILVAFTVMFINFKKSSKNNPSDTAS